MGSGVPGTNKFTIKFPSAFISPPLVVATAQQIDSRSLPDTFAVTVTSVTTGSFDVNVLRVDDSNGWDQDIHLAYIAVAP
jgi:hypothetical protein